MVGGLAGGGHTAGAQAPTSPSVQICGNATVLSGPSTAPDGAVTIPAGIDGGSYNAANTTYYFATGTHTLPPGEYSEILAGKGDTYVGAPGAILSGSGDHHYAFAAPASSSPGDVTIEYLTIEDFTPPGANGAVNVNGGVGWTVKNDTIEHNSPGSGLMIGSDDDITGSCLTENGEYGFNAYSTDDTASLTGGIQNVTVTGNEISYNDTCNWEDVSPDPVPSADLPANCAGTSAGQFSGCGCSGGGKFWETDGANVTDNYVHNNFNVGLWADTDNTGFDWSGNYISDNAGVGIMEEISYNFSITDNTFVDNAWLAGAKNSRFPTGAVYISESGGDAQVPGAYSGTALISGNSFTDNWDGVVLWENANRYCSDGSDGVCTLVDPGVFTRASCAANLSTAVAGADTGSPSADYYDGCRWKTQNVSVTDNVFNLTPADITGCAPSSNVCGENAIFSEYGKATYSGAAVPTAIAFHQNNVFGDNTYAGPWTFMAWNQGNEDDPVSFGAWSSPVTDDCSTAQEVSSGTCNSGFGQDAGSVYNSVASPTVTTQSVTTTTRSVTTTTQPDTTTTAQTPTTQAPPPTTQAPPPTTGPPTSTSIPIPSGPPALVGSQDITEAATTISGAATTGKMFTATTWCTGNRKLLSGGYTLRDGEANLHDLVITQDAPRLTSGNGGWTASVEVNNANLNKTAGSLTAYAVCAG